MNQDIANNVKATVGWAGATISSNTDTVSAVVIDMQGFESLMFMLHSGTRTDGSYLPKIRETDNVDGSTGAAEVPSYQVQDTLTSSNVVKKVGAKINKRYAVLYISSTVVTSGCVFKSAVALLSGARNAPVA